MAGVIIQSGMFFYSNGKLDSLWDLLIVIQAQDHALYAWSIIFLHYFN